MIGLRCEADYLPFWPSEGRPSEADIDGTWERLASIPLGLHVAAA